VSLRKAIDFKGYFAKWSVAQNFLLLLRDMFLTLKIQS